MSHLRKIFFPDARTRLALAEASAAGQGLPAPRRYFSWIAIMLSLTLAVLDGTIANVALPSIAAHFHAEAADSIRVVTGYQLAIVVTLLPFATLADIRGFRNVYLGGIALFTVASLFCTMAGSMNQLTAARVVQGIGAAGLMSINMSILRFTVARDRLGAAVGLNAMVVALAATLGPAIAGAILSVTSWHWLFAINIPLGLLALLIGWPSLPETLRVKRPFDWKSALLSALGMGLFITGVDGIGAHYPIWISALQFAGGVLCFVLLLRHESDVERPMFPVDLLRIPAFSLSVVTSIASFTAQILASVSLPFTFQSGMHMAPSQVGLLMMPWPLTIAVIAPIAGRLSDRYPPAILGGVGLACLAAGLFALGTLGPDAGIWDIVWRMSLSGAGFALFQSPNNRTLLEAAPMKRSGAASGMLGAARLTGQSLGSALVALLLGRMGLAGAPWALYVGAAFAVVAAFLSLSRLSVAHAPADEA